MDNKQLNEKNTLKNIEAIIGEIKCPKDFICYKSGFKNLCKAEDVGRKSILKCLEENPVNCVFAFPIGQTYFCQCPLRFYIARELKK